MICIAPDADASCWASATAGERMFPRWSEEGNETTDVPLSVVAQRTGYGSAYAFANAFKREYGVSAGRYRQQRHTGSGTQAARGEA